MYLKVLSSLVLAQLVAAQQYGAPPDTSQAAPAPAPSAPPNTPGHINVDVFPNGNYTFSPSNFTAQIGDLVTFYIPSGQIAHSITQSSFADPCTYLAANGSNPAGFDSGLQAAKTFTINITSTNPIWFHCKQLLHCGMGMVGSINAPTNGTNTHEAFLARAMAIGPKETAETDSGTPVLTGLGAIATGAPASAGASTPSGATKTVARGSLYLAAASFFIFLI